MNLYYHKCCLLKSLYASDVDSWYCTHCIIAMFPINHNQSANLSLVQLHLGMMWDLISFQANTRTDHCLIIKTNADALYFADKSCAIASMALHRQWVRNFIPGIIGLLLCIFTVGVSFLNYLKFKYTLGKATCQSHNSY